MATRVSDALLPTTMVGSYPRPRWFTHQLGGRDVLEAFKSVEHAEAYRDATRVVIGDQEDAGLDVVTDGQMWFDDLHMGIGSFFWYWFERIPGFGPEMVLHRNRDRASGRDVFVMDEAGAAILRGEVARGPLRLAYLYQCARDATAKPAPSCAAGTARSCRTTSTSTSTSSRSTSRVARWRTPRC